MKKNLFLIIMVCMHLILVAQPSKMQKPLIILDTDMGSSTDDVAALKKLCLYVKEGKCTLLGVNCDRKGDYNAQMIKVMLSYYGCGSVPIGIERSYPDSYSSPHIFIDYCDRMHWDTITKDWTPISVWSNKVYRKCNPDTLPDGYDLYCELLRKADDHSVTIISIGFMTTLCRLLSTPEGIDLVSRKVDKIYIMGAKFKQNPDSYNSKLGYNLGKLGGKTASVSPIYAATVFQNLSDCVNLIFSPDTVGESLGRYEIHEVLRDLKFDTLDPMYQIYSKWHVDDNQYMWDVIPVIACVDGDYDNQLGLTLSEAGRVHVNLNTCKEKADDEWTDNSRIVFSPNSSGNVRFLIIKDPKRPGFKEWFNL